MDNPWENIRLEDYENHMKLENVFQLQMLNQIMKEQLNKYPVEKIAIWGIAGGNGLEHINTQKIKKIYAIDINPEYLLRCQKRHAHLKESLVTCCIDLMNESVEILKVDFIVANLLVEYIGIQKLIIHIKKIFPKYLSLVIQQNEEEDSFISHSPYLDRLTPLSTIFAFINKEELSNQLSCLDYKCCMQQKYNLPNSKSFIRLDYCTR